MNYTTIGKTAAPLPKLASLTMEGHISSVDIDWAITTSYPDQIVSIMYRKADNSDFFVEVTQVDRDDGSIAIINLVQDTQYTIWIRPETAIYYGEWQAYLALTEEGWDSGTEAVTINGTLVSHLGDLVTIATA
jgi:hypothetical protein